MKACKRLHCAAKKIYKSNLQKISMQVLIDALLFGAFVMQALALIGFNIS